MTKSVYSKKVEIRNKSISGKGLFAKEYINSGEIVFIKGGHILHKNELYTSSKINSYLPISDDYYIGAKHKFEESKIKLYQNHSCDPNCGLRGEITFVAIRDIKKDEELTVDYAFIDDDDYEFTCTCGSKNCRKTITGKDWKIKSLQKKYYPYFSKYLQQKIDNENK